MERIEYRDVVDKSDWPRGEWDAEPDKIQWQDGATGLPCLIVRNGVGALCGYVGVPKGHPWHGVRYSECPEKCGEKWCDHRPESHLEAHGGITFTDSCSDTSRESWEDWRKRWSLRTAEAERYPKGDAATGFKHWAGCFDDYDAWRKRAEASYICHKAENDCVWWFGFDCAHLGDLAPTILQYRREALRIFGDDVYRNVAYVAQECQHLAQQLNDV